VEVPFSHYLARVAAHLIILRLSRLLPLIKELGIDVRRAGGQRRAAFAGHLQGFGTKSRLLARPFGGRGFFHGIGKLVLNSLLFHSTTLKLFISLNS
jgi:hypothetical protein